jgi:hypothetical protein
MSSFKTDVPSVSLESPVTKQITKTTTKTVSPTVLQTPTFKVETNLRQQTKSLNKQLNVNKLNTGLALGLATNLNLVNSLSYRPALGLKSLQYTNTNTLTSLRTNLITSSTTDLTTSTKLITGQSYGGSTGINPIPIITPITPFALPGLPSFGGFVIPKPKKLGKTAPVNIAPSFSGIVTETKITSPLLVSKTLGVTPFQVRGILVDKKGRRKKGKYFKITNL